MRSSLAKADEARKDEIPSSVKQLSERAPFWQRVSHVYLPKRLTNYPLARSAVTAPDFVVRDGRLVAELPGVVLSFSADHKRPRVPDAADLVMLATLTGMTKRKMRDARHEAAMIDGKVAMMATTAKRNSRDRFSPLLKAAPRSAERIVGRRAYGRAAKQIAAKPEFLPLQTLEFSSLSSLMVALGRNPQSMPQRGSVRRGLAMWRRMEITSGKMDEYTAITKLRLKDSGPIRITLHSSLLVRRDALKVKLKNLPVDLRSPAMLNLYLLLENWCEPIGDGAPRVHIAKMDTLAQKIGLPEHWESWKKSAKLIALLKRINESRVPGDEYKMMGLDGGKLEFRRGNRAPSMRQPKKAEKVQVYNAVRGAYEWRDKQSKPEIDEDGFRIDEPGGSLSVDEEGD